MSKKLIGIQSLRTNRHITIPVKFLRQAIVEKDERGNEKFYVRFLSNNDRVEIDKNTYNEVVTALAYA